MTTARRHCLAALLLALAAGTAAAEDGPAVAVSNRSEPVRCAEQDNVTLEMASAEVRRFTVAAQHPAYIGALAADRFAPDWTACDFKEAATGGPPPERQTIYEDQGVWLVGHVFPAFWRKDDVPVTVAGRTTHNLSLLQLWVRHSERAEEVLVLYPPDGYWRARPLPPKRLGWTAYGSSFLIGPVEREARPLVRLKAVGFDPKERRFTLDFVAGGSATVTLAKLDRESIDLDVRFDEAVAGRPFAALRSMYVTAFNNDAARVAVLPPGGKGWIEDGVMSYPGGPASVLWVGRLVPSRHNTSAPDMIFRDFRESP